MSLPIPTASALTNLVESLGRGEWIDLTPVIENGMPRWPSHPIWRVGGTGCAISPARPRASPAAARPGSSRASTKATGWWSSARWICPEPRGRGERETAALPGGRCVYLPARRCQRVAFSIFLCFFFRMRLRRFLISDPMSGGQVSAVTGNVAPLHAGQLRRWLRPRPRKCSALPSSCVLASAEPWCPEQDQRCRTQH